MSDESMGMGDGTPAAEVQRRAAGFAGLRGAARLAVAGIVAAAALAIALTDGRAQGRGDAKGGGSLGRFFVSGNSLNDGMYGHYVAGIESGLAGAPVDWNQQILIGSPTRMRTRGGGRPPDEWPGYGLGFDRSGKTGNNVLQAFARGGANPYRTLLITEGHQSVGALIWNEPSKYLRHYHERLLEHNPAARTFFMEPWESLISRDDIAPWVELERQAVKVWECAVTRVNLSLEHERRPDRIGYIPTGGAIAALIDATAKGQIGAFKVPGPRAAVSMFLSDEVHLNDRGKYFAAVLSHVVAANRPLQGAWRPQGMPPGEAAALQAFAWSYHADRAKSDPPLDLPACRRFMVSTFCDTWNNFMSDSKWVRRQESCKSFFSRETAQNPFVFDPATDKAHWFSAP